MSRPNVLSVPCFLLSGGHFTEFQKKKDPKPKLVLLTPVGYSLFVFSLLLVSRLLSLSCCLCSGFCRAHFCSAVLIDTLVLIRLNLLSQDAQALKWAADLKALQRGRFKWMPVNQIQDVR